MPQCAAETMSVLCEDSSSSGFLPTSHIHPHDRRFTSDFSTGCYGDRKVQCTPRHADSSSSHMPHSPSSSRSLDVIA